MNPADSLFYRWIVLEKKLETQFGKKPDLEAVLFLIGMQEYGVGGKKFSKEQKQDLMHIAICTVLSSSGYYALEMLDEEGWPHFRQLIPMPPLNPIEQENFIKDHVLLYFEKNKFFKMNHKFLFVAALLFSASLFAQKEIKIKKKDRKRDVLMITDMGDITLRLSDSTPLHRDNFLKLVKSKYYEGVLFHRVISNFMIQAGDPKSKDAPAGKLLGGNDVDYTIPAEFKPTLIHKKGALAAARTGDNINPSKASSGGQFYLVIGKKVSDNELANIEKKFPNGLKYSDQQKEIYKTAGGTAFLDQGYTVFGETVAGLDVIEKIGKVETSKGADRDRPLADVHIKEMKLIKRKKAR